MSYKLYVNTNFVLVIQLSHGTQKQVGTEKMIAEYQGYHNLTADQLNYNQQKEILWITKNYHEPLLR